MLRHLNRRGLNGISERAVIVLLYFCYCFIGYLPCGGKLGCSAGNNRVVRRGTIGLFGGEQ
jgi:hypothetical protein